MLYILEHITQYNKIKLLGHLVDEISRSHIVIKTHQKHISSSSTL
jgi:hypothetical protein